MTRGRALVIAGLCVVAGGCKQLPQQLLIAGSSTLHRYMEPLVKRYRVLRPDVNTINETGGTTAGIIAVKRAAIDVALAARDLESDEDDELLRNYLVARDGIAIVVNVKSPLTDVSKRQLTDIYEERITSWSALGGPDVPIAIIVREATAPAQVSLRDLLLSGDEMPRGKLVEGRPGMVKAVADDPNAVGFLPLGALTDEVRAKIKILTVDGVPMSRLTVLSGRYPLTRSFYLITQGVKNAPVVDDFISFVLSPEGQKELLDQGLVPVY